MTVLASAHVDTFVRDHLPPPDEWPDLVFALPQLQYRPHLNAAVELLDRTEERWGGDRPCLVTDRERWSYHRLRETVDRIAGVLSDECRVVPGSRVLLRSPNNPWLVAAWLAVLKAGAVAVTTMPLLRASELREIIELAQVGLAVCDHRLLDELRAADPALAVVAFGGEAADDLTRRAADRPPAFTAVRTRADDPCLIAFTSGTTGTPKGCVHAHRDVLAIADTFSAHVLRPRPDDVFIGSPPIAFTFGLGGLVVFPLRAGASTVLVEQAGPAALAEAIARHRATVCFSAPTAYRAMLACDVTALDCLRRAVSAGEALPRSTWERWRERTGLRLIDGLGSTEMLHIFISAADDAIRPGATGRVVPGYDARVVDDDGRELPAGIVGRLAVRGPTGCRYLGDARQRHYVRGGWNLTGDAYRRDDDGYFWYQGRLDDLIISAGYNIAGPEVEAALLSHPDVAEAAVVGIPDDERGAIVTAFVVLQPGVSRGADTTDRLQAHAKAAIAPYKYPRSIVFLDELPRTPTGKLQRFKLREQPHHG